jgi:hypothetical protein
MQVKGLKKKQKRSWEEKKLKEIGSVRILSATSDKEREEKSGCGSTSRIF